MATTIQQIELPKKARAVDTSGNNNHGQIYSGRGLEFDGVGDYLSIADDASIRPTDNITVACWVYLNSSTGWQTIWGKKDNIANGIWIAIKSGGQVNVELDGVVSYTSFNSGNNKLADGVWYRLVMTYDYLSGGVIYINGQSAGSVSDTGAITQPSSTAYQIGNMDSGYVLDGNMSDFQLWDSTWTAADVTYDYLNPESLALNNSGTALTESNLKLWYPMQDGHRGQQSYILDGANTGLGTELSPPASDITQWSTVSEATQSGTSFIMPSGGYIFENISITSGTGKWVIEGSGDVRYRSNTADAYVTVTLPATVYPAFGSTNARIQLVNSSGSDVTISNVSVKAINDKHHATTVFYGDDISDVAQGTFTGGALTGWSLIGSASDTTGGADYADITSSGSSNELIRTTSNFTTVVGRTYRVTFDRVTGTGVSRCYVDTSTETVSGDSSTAGTYTLDFVATATGHKVGFRANTSSVRCFIDNVKVSEVGVASGWTDADQQLHIPQTALQSYNELAWGNSASANYVTATPDPNFGKADFSISYAFYADDADGSEKVFAMNTPLVVRRIEGNELKIYASDGTANTGYTAVTPASAIKNGRWHHVIENWNYTSGDWDNLSIYLDGVKMSESSDLSSLDGDVDFNYTGDHHFGKYDSSTSLTGVITEIAYWKGINFTDAEVLELFNDGKALDASTHSAEVR
jgi:hypothetical protein